MYGNGYGYNAMQGGMQGYGGGYGGMGGFQGGQGYSGMNDGYQSGGGGYGGRPGTGRVGGGAYGPRPMGGGGGFGGGFVGGRGQRMDQEFVEGKLFLGGLDNATTKETLLDYCSQWCVAVQRASNLMHLLLDCLVTLVKLAVKFLLRARKEIASSGGLLCPRLTSSSSPCYAQDTLSYLCFQGRGVRLCADGGARVRFCYL